MIGHAAERSIQRFISKADIQSCGRTAKKIEFQHEKKTWKVIGKDLDKEKITVVCSLKDDLLIVTVF
jgi:hypothetical protein